MTLGSTSPLALSLVVLCRNERDQISACLDSLLSQTLPDDDYEILVVDGMSDDGTRDKVMEYAAVHPRVRLIDNPRCIIPAASNAGIRASRGDAIAILSAHASYEPDYFADCLDALVTYGADQVGAVAQYLPRRDSHVGWGIAIALAHPLGGGGNARYKIGAKEPRWVDTAFAACFRRDLFERVGLFREWFRRSDDMDFAVRAQREGARVLLLPRTGMVYHARSRLAESFRHSFDNGMWITYPLAVGVRAFRWRHLLSLILFLGLTGPWFAAGLLDNFSLWIAILPGLIYAAAVQSVSLFEAIKRRNLHLTWSLACALTILHIAYGMGSAWGLVRATKGRFRRERIPPPQRLPPRGFLESPNA